MKTVTGVITGASAGLGRTIAHEFGRYGANVGLLARGVDGLSAAKHEIEMAGKAIVLPVDLSRTAKGGIRWAQLLQAPTPEHCPVIELL